MENKNFMGIGQENLLKYKTNCMFIETIYMKNIIMNILAKIFWNLGKIQECYFKDLEKK
jgi:hypothetical protein